MARSDDMRREIADLRSKIQQRPTLTSGISGEKTFVRVRQTSHGLIIGDVIRHNGTIWTKSQADTAANAVVGGMVVTVLSADVFVLATGGYVAGLSGLTAGEVHYLDASTAGELTTTAPSIAVPVILADTTSSGVLLGMAAPPAAGLLRYNGMNSPTTLSSGTGTVSTGGKPYMFLEMMGGGGASSALVAAAIFGYCAATSGGSPTRAIYTCGTANGGGGGAFIQALIDISGASSWDYAIGAAGTTGGTNGGDTTFTVSAKTLTAGGGKTATAPAAGAGGVAAVSSSSFTQILDLLMLNGGAGGTVTNSIIMSGNYNMYGMYGAPGGYWKSSGSGAYGYGGGGPLNALNNPVGGAIRYVMFA